MRKTLFAFVAFLLIASFSTNHTHATVVVPGTTEPAPKTEPGSEEVKNAVDAFKSLSRKERKAKIREVKKELKDFKKQSRQGDAPSDNTVLLVILAILLPPLAVYLHQGEINTKFWISLLLTLLFWIPGVIYALIVVLGAD